MLTLGSSQLFKSALHICCSLLGGWFIHLVPQPFSDLVLLFIDLAPLFSDLAPLFIDLASLFSDLTLLFIDLAPLFRDLMVLFSDLAPLFSP